MAAVILLCVGPGNVLVGEVVKYIYSSKEPHCWPILAHSLLRGTFYNLVLFLISHRLSLELAAIKWVE